MNNQLNFFFELYLFYQTDNCIGEKETDKCKNDLKNLNLLKKNNYLYLTNFKQTIV